MYIVFVRLKKIILEISGIEPEASCMQSKHSTTELYPQLLNKWYNPSRNM